MFSRRPLFAWLGIAVLAAGFAACFVPADAAEEPQDKPRSFYEQTLREKKIEPTAEGLNKYFHGLHPSPEQEARAKHLIEQLGSTDSFAEREEATAGLLVMPTLPSEMLIAAAEGEDPEVRWRAKRILELGKPEAERTILAALRFIDEQKLPGVTEELIAAIPLLDKQYHLFAARQALAAAAQEGDAELLMQASKHDNAEVRIAATDALGKALGKKAAGHLTSLLTDKDDRVKLSAARAIADYGGRSSLQELAKLLDSQDQQVRVNAGITLRELTGESFGYAAYESAEKRAESVKKWNEWIAASGETAKLNYPLKHHYGGISYLGGNTLLAFGYSNKVEEIDPSGKVIWSYPCQGPWSAERMANGHTLIAEYSASRILEVNSDKEIVWEYPLNALNAKPLPNGNVLAADHSGSRAVEITPEKTVAWEYKTQASCSDVHRLENGNTLVASYGRPIEEVTPDGKVVWQYQITTSYGCQPLPNGNILIADFNGKVVEVTKDKDVVWDFAEGSLVDCFRLPNGNTLLTGGNRFVEVTPDKKIIWELSGNSYGSARR